MKSKFDMNLSLHIKNILHWKIFSGRVGFIISKDMIKLTLKSIYTISFLTKFRSTTTLPLL